MQVEQVEPPAAPLAPAAAPPLPLHPLQVETLNFLHSEAGLVHRGLTPQVRCRGCMHCKTLPRDRFSQPGTWYVKITHLVPKINPPGT
jgi:hypothetical protein